MRNTISYIHNSSKLTLEGLPDLSLNQDNGSIGILSNWQLQIVGLTELEGKREHLEQLMNVVYPYARHLVSSVKKTFGELKDPVAISSNNSYHQIMLRSSKPGIAPMELQLDDAELSDLLRCLDDLINDQRVLLTWNIPRSIPLSRREIIGKLPILQRFTAPVLGITTMLFCCLIFSVIPTPQRESAGENYLDNTDLIQN